MVDAVAVRRGTTSNAVEDGMTLKQIELAYHFAQRERVRDNLRYRAAVCGGIVAAFKGE